MTAPARRPKRYTAYIQWNARRGWYAGYIPGLGGSETVGDNMDDLKANLRETLTRKIAENRSRAKAQAKPRPGYHRIDIEV